jgi:transposase-like protein
VPDRTRHERQRLRYAKDLGQCLSIERKCVPKQRRRFTAQFKAEAVQTVIETRKPTAAVPHDLGIHDITLGNCVTAYRRAHPEPDQPLACVEPARVTELEVEIGTLRMEQRS